MRENFMLTLVGFTPEVQMIRVQVFQREQGVPAALEFDAYDDKAQHLLAYWDNQPVGTARLRSMAPDVVKLERVAVLAEYRSRGIGRRMMVFAIAHLRQQGVRLIRLHAQVPVVDFYQSLGFVVQGEQFYEAEIAHRAMVLLVGNE